MGGGENRTSPGRPRAMASAFPIRPGNRRDDGRPPDVPMVHMSADGEGEGPLVPLPSIDISKISFAAMGGSAEDLRHAFPENDVAYDVDSSDEDLDGMEAAVERYERRAAELRLAEEGREGKSPRAGMRNGMRNVPGGGFKTPDGAGRRMMSTRDERERLRRADEASMRTPPAAAVDRDERFVAPSTLDRRFDPAPNTSRRSIDPVDNNPEDPASVVSKPRFTTHAASEEVGGDVYAEAESGARFTPKPGGGGGSWSIETAVLALDDESDARKLGGTRRALVAVGVEPAALVHPRLSLSVSSRVTRFCV